MSSISGREVDCTGTIFGWLGGVSLIRAIIVSNIYERVNVHTPITSHCSKALPGFISGHTSLAIDWVHLIIFTLRIILYVVRSKCDGEDTGRYSNSRMTGSGSVPCTSARNCPFQTRFSMYECQGGGNISNRFPAAPSIHPSVVTW